jgi:glycine cleavage system H lipoate-binding protein
MILRTPQPVPEERCSSAEYRTCPIIKEVHEDQVGAGHCPFLLESLVQYCAATSAPKYVPYSESMLTRCGTSNHRYCELYLVYSEVAYSSKKKGLADRARKNGEEDIPAPSDLFYTPNHLWLDVSPEGCCHVGIDGFAARVLGAITAVKFVSEKWGGNPAVVLSASGMEIPFVFPKRLAGMTVNNRVLFHSDRLSLFPYTFGWLFEGKELHLEQSGKQLSENLMTGENAVQWMKKEIRKLHELVQNYFIPARNSAMPTMMDGGFIAPDFFRHLERDEVMVLVNEFFSPARKPEAQV